MARKYTASESASGWTKLGKARRKITKIKRKTAIGQGALSLAGSIAAFGMGQAKKADTAWGEYEAGYEALGGEGFERPKFGQKGFFKGPEGEVQIGKGRHQKTYDSGQILKAGAFLSSDASAVLDEGARAKYLERTAPGTRSIYHGKTKTNEFNVQQPTIAAEHAGGVDPLGAKRMRVADSGNISDFNVQQPIDTSD